MTYEEALSRANFCIEEWKMFLKDKANTVEAVRYQNDSSQMQFFEVAAEAINKQIPKKPIRYVTAFPSCCMVSKCPNCGQEFGFNTGFNFCENCGQRLDFRSDAE